jgi:hypothetical protein
MPYDDTSQVDKPKIVSCRRGKSFMQPNAAKKSFGQKKSQSLSLIKKAKISESKNVYLFFLHYRI